MICVCTLPIFQKVNLEDYRKKEINIMSSCKQNLCLAVTLRSKSEETTVTTGLILDLNPDDPFSVILIGLYHSLGGEIRL